MAGSRQTSERHAASPLPIRLARVQGKRVVILASRFNQAVTEGLVDGARQVLRRYGMTPARMPTYWVPGVFELPAVAAAVAATQHPDAMIALGCLLKGETPQYAALGYAVAQGLTQVSVAQGIPISFGVIIADSFAQAKARAGRGPSNRGREAALAALAMIDLMDELSNTIPETDAKAHESA